MYYIKHILFGLVLVFMAISCQDSYNDNLQEPDLIDDGSGRETALDRWLYEKFTLPYNIEVKYEWDASEADIYKTLVPPKTDKVETVMDVVHQVWIEPFVSIAGQDFIKKLCPKQFVLVGSARYNFDGSITLGTAEGGRKVVLYVINDFEKNERFEVKQMMHTIEHEFTHILNQNISYPAAFKEVTPGGYTASWSSVPLGDARANGFITSYAMASPDEDFAEMVSIMLIEGKQGFENILSCETTDVSYNLIRRKEKFVVDYFRNAFKIDFYALQTKVQEAIQAIAPDNGNGGGEEPPALLDVWGYGKEYQTMNVDLMTMLESAEVTSRYVYDNNILHNNNLALDYNFKLTYNEANIIMLTLYYYTINTEVREYKEANLIYRISDDMFDPGVKAIGLLNGDDNANYIVNTLGASKLATYFNGRFYIDWAVTCSGYRYAGLFPREAPGSYCLGVLGN